MSNNCYLVVVIISDSTKVTINFTHVSDKINNKVKCSIILLNSLFNEIKVLKYRQASTEYQQKLITIQI